MRQKEIAVRLSLGGTRGIAGTGGSLFLRKGLVATQAALSFLLLFGAGHFVRNLLNLQTTDTGVALDNLLVIWLVMKEVLLLLVSGLMIGIPSAIAVSTLALRYE